MPLTIMVKHQTYNDGVLKYYSLTPRYNASKKKIGDDKVLKGKLNYELAYKRQQDYDFADYIIELNNEFYECYLCENSDKFSNYLYLQKVTL